MGNGMHLAQVCANFFYILFNIMRREDAMRLWPLPTPMPSGNDQDDEASAAGEGDEHHDLGDSGGGADSAAGEGD